MAAPGRAASPPGRQSGQPGPRYFGTDGIRGRAGEHPVTEEFFHALGHAAAPVFNGARVLLGRDPRISSPPLEAALEAGLCATGLEVARLGIASTPMVACLAHTLHAGGAVISASHNHYSDNGVKFFGPGGRKLSEREERVIEQRLANPAKHCVAPGGRAVPLENAGELYLEHCRKLFPGLCLDGLRLVLDCAHGATYQLAPSLFSELGAKIETLGTAPDGRNINAGCGTMQPHALRERVRNGPAGLGIAFDGDGDRLLIIETGGASLDGDDLLYLLARRLRKHLNGALVGTVMSNLGLERAVQGLGLQFHRVPVGDRYVLELLHREQLKLGGESSGHLVHLDYSTTGDGMLTALLVLAGLPSSGDAGLAALAPTLRKHPQVLVNLPLPGNLEISSLPALKPAVAAAERRLGKTGRVLLRRSGTEPLLRLLVEGEDPDLVQALAGTIRDAAQRTMAE